MKSRRSVSDTAQCIKIFKPVYKLHRYYLRLVDLQSG